MRLDPLLKTAIVASFTALFSCSNPSNDSNKDAESNKPALDIAKIEQIIGMKGTEKDGE